MTRRALLVKSMLAVGPFAGRQRAAHPDGAFVEMGQELRADGSANGEVDGDGEENGGDADGDVAIFEWRREPRCDSVR